MTVEQIRQMRINNLNTAAQARLTDQEARIKKVEADAAERYGVDKADFDYQKSELSVKEMRARIDNIVAETAKTASERERLEKMMDAATQIVQQQARAGKLDLDALENVAAIGGLEANKQAGIVKLLIDAVRTLMRSK